LSRLLIARVPFARFFICRIHPVVFLFVSPFYPCVFYATNAALEEGWGRIKSEAIDVLFNLLDNGLLCDGATRRQQAAAAADGDASAPAPPGQVVKAVDNAKFMEVYQLTYTMCVQRAPDAWADALYWRQDECGRAYLRDRVMPALQASLTAAGAGGSVRATNPRALLAEMSRRWRNHRLMAKWMARFFRYLDNYHVENRNLPRIEEASMVAFRTEVYERVRQPLTASILEIIDQGRQASDAGGSATGGTTGGGGGSILADDDRRLVKSCASLYVDMLASSLDYYEPDLHDPFIAASTAYYKARSDEWIRSDNVPGYLQRVETALVAESQLVEGCFHADTSAPLLGALQTVLLTGKRAVLVDNESSGLRVLLRDNRTEDIARMYRLFHRIDQGKGAEPLARIVRDHFLDLGHGIVRAREAAATAGAGAAAGAGAGGGGGSGKPAGGAGAAAKEEAGDPAFVLALLGLHERAQSLVQKQFDANPAFGKAAKDAFEQFINKETPGTKFSTTEHIAGYCDRLLRSGSAVAGEHLSEAQIEEKLSLIVELFGYIADKDVFGDIYRTQLAKRVLNQRSASVDLEKSMISKLKLRCGAQYTSKLEGMLNDLEAGDINAAFRTYQASQPAGTNTIDCSVQVLTSGWWPAFAQVERLVLPACMQTFQTHFCAFYAGATQHRRLQWIPSLGTATVKATFGSAAKPMVYELSVATLQAVALAYFNDCAGPRSLDEVQTALGCDVEVVKRTLHSLSCGKLRVLVKSPEGNSIGANDTFAYNAAFASPLRKLRIPMASLEETRNPQKVEDDRSHSIEAAIVRVMKARKGLAHATLVSEVMAQLHFFRPAPKAIKKRIEHLIERDYLERDTADSNFYKYVA
jgi:cullin 1